MERFEMANSDVVYLYEGGIELIEIAEARSHQESIESCCRRRELPPRRTMQPQKEQYQKNTYAKTG